MLQMYALKRVLTITRKFSTGDASGRNTWNYVQEAGLPKMHQFRFSLRSEVEADG